MSIHAWHILGVAVPYFLIATALWGLAGGAVKDAVHVGSLPRHVAGVVGGRTVRLPTIPLAYSLAFAGVAFIYGCVLDRTHTTAAIGADPHALAAGADAFLYGLALTSWLSALLLTGGYVWLRRGTCRLLSAPVARDRAEARYRLLAEHLTDLVAHHEPDGRYEWLSPSVTDILGYWPRELVGRDPYELFHPDDVDRIRTESHELLLDGRASDTVIRYRMRRKDGEYIWLESLTETILDASGAIARLQVSSRDITKQLATEDDLQRRAHHDPLTGLANRALFTLRLDALVESAGPEGDYAVLYIDLDRFKAVNDTLGHAAGDELLIQLADRLRLVTRDCDTVARIGGDEFAVIVAEVASAEGARAAAERVERTLRTPFDLDGTRRPVSASIGVAIGRPDHARSGEVLREADLAAYAAKADPTASWALFSPAMREAADRRLRLEADLDRAVERGELRVAYQPVVDIATGRLHGVEALVRWQHPELGMLYPDTFISIAEETGRIGEVDRWVMAEGLRQLERWDAQAGRPLDLLLSVNCSARDLHEPLFAEHVQAMLLQGPDRAGRLVIEITESLLVDDPRRAAAVLEALHAEGVRFAMDDFGTGYSSLSVIHALPVDTVKIDRAFVQRMDEDEAAREMVRTVIGFARTLGTEIVAEGIETAEQRAALVEMGCDWGQGYLFARPLPPDEIATLIAADAALGEPA
ncbi:putative bifunctional diguanylate cyclase/phosphodiesterase [Rubrivirga sp. IMCC45206]|uniref:putative bifunctional diguanylate cyclase/phosphodiesterase n=1 Tax=Rubrivirga sp. IMCC45206 TaxID=3391614 RepID=UPI00398FBFE0